jgi:hypothetical protein
VRGLFPLGYPAQILGAILAAGREVATFNGMCGAESGQVPVSATAPSVLVREIGSFRLAAGKLPSVTTFPRGAKP